MELNRLLRALRSRWGIVALISIVGFASAFGLTALATDDVEEVFEASIVIQFELEGEETVEDLADEIESERSIAVFAAQELLIEYPGASIVADTGSARLIFFARGSTSEEARTRSQDLVSAYLDSDPTTGGDINAQLAEIERRATEIQGELNSLVPSLTPEEESLKSQHDLLDLKIQRLEGEIASLIVADAGASAEVQRANADRIADLEEERVALQEEKSLLPPPPSEELSPTEQFRRDVLNRMMDFLELEYQRFAMRSLGVTGTGGAVQPVTVDNLTPDPPNPIMNGVVGLIGGAGIALFALALTIRARREIWLPEDVPLPVLAVVPKRRASDMPGPPWYDTADGGERKESIQALRTAIEGGLDQPTTSLAVLGDGVDSSECHKLGVDIATAFASAGYRVLVVDGDYTFTGDQNEINVGEPSLGSVLGLPLGSTEALTERVSAVLEDAIQVRPGLIVVPSGSPPASPADSLAGQQFRLLIDRARSSFDLTVVIAGKANSPMSRVIAQRLGNVLVAVSPGKTNLPSIRSLTRDFETQRVKALGAVMISGAEPRGVLGRIKFPSWARESSSMSRPPREPQQRFDSPVSRLRFYPSPMEKGSGSVQGGSLRALVGDLSDDKRTLSPPPGPQASERHDHRLGSEVLASLRKIDDASGAEPVAEYLVARVEDIMTAVSGQENLSKDLIEVVLQSGFIPLVPVRGSRTVGQWLVEELRWELGPEQGESVASEFGRLLRPGGADTAGSLDEWLMQEFFERHVQRTDGEPEVWHLTSEAGAVQVLAYGRRLNRERLTDLNTEIVRRRIDDFQRQLQQAIQSDDLAAAEQLEAYLRDLHLFEVAIGMLQVGSSEEARLSYPWRRADQQPRGWVPVWAEGIRPNIAPLQRMGLLARPVLTEDELFSTQSAV